MTSIRKKITNSYILIIITTVIIIQIILYFIIKGYYYNNLKDTIAGQIKISSDFYNTYLSSDTLEKNVLNNADMFWSNTKCRVQLINLDGKVIMDSLGNIPTSEVKTSELSDILKGKATPVVSVYKNQNNSEKYVSVTTPLFYETGINGVLRYTASTRGVDRTIDKLVTLLCILGIMVIIVSSTVSIFISNSIMRPLKRVCIGAERMAKGNLKDAIPKYSDDEIGKLADTLNYMSDEILKNEKLKNEFISSVSHELRTPLTSIKGWTIVLESSDLEDKEEINEGLNIINEEVERLTSLVEELLDFSKLTSGKITLKKEETDMYKFMLGILKQLEPRFNINGITVAFQKAEVLKAYIDRNKIKQVLINILDNSIKYSPQDSQIDVKITKEEEYIKIQLKDSGYGIDEEDLPHVKEKFYKGKDQQSGYGIGLSVCQEIINQHGGRLDLESTINLGTIVTISIPTGEMI